MIAAHSVGPVDIVERRHRAALALEGLATLFESVDPRMELPVDCLGGLVALVAHEARAVIPRDPDRCAGNDPG